MGVVMGDTKGNVRSAGCLTRSVDLNMDRWRRVEHSGGKRRRGGALAPHLPAGVLECLPIVLLLEQSARSQSRRTSGSGGVVHVLFMCCSCAGGHCHRRSASHRTRPRIASCPSRRFSTVHHRQAPCPVAVWSPPPPPPGNPKQPRLQPALLPFFLFFCAILRKSAGWVACF